eukprot:jgi/Astpho2/6962/Aster-x0296
MPGYQREYDIPQEFPAVLKGFAREVLRAQPDNIYEFGARYFQELKEQHAHAPGQAAHSAVQLMQDMKAAELQAQLLQQCTVADPNGVGTVDRSKLKQILIGPRMGLDQRQMLLVLAACLEDEAGQIDYRSCIPDMAQAWLQASLPATTAAATTAQGLSEQQLHTMLVQSFAQADPEASGSVSRQALKDLLQSPDCKLAPREVNLLLSSVEARVDGMAEYQVVIDNAFRWLTMQ